MRAGEHMLGRPSAPEGAAAPWVPPTPRSELERLRDLRTLDLHRLIGARSLQTLVSSAALAFDVSTAAISLVDETSELYIASFGVGTCSGSRTEAFCAHTIAGNDVFVLNDASLDDRFKSHPKVVRGELRFYAGAPVHGPAGQPIGALCVRDTTPQRPSRRQIDLLRHFAELATEAIRAELLHKEYVMATESLAREAEQRSQLQSQLLQAHKLESIGQLASGIAHEINTPTQYISDNVRFLRGQFGALLKAIDSYAAQLDQDAPAKSWTERANDIRATLDQLDYEFVRREIPLALDQSLEGLDRVTTIVRAMKDFSHPGSSEKDPTDLNHAIETTATVCRNRWKYVADLELNLDSSLPPAPCNGPEINQVILNLIVNAADAIAERGADSENKGCIRVSTHRDGDWAVIAVEDNGVGIEPEHWNRVFDPFFTTKDVGVGTGQGLAISRNVVVDKHRGSIDFESTPGLGSRFVVRLPLSTPEEEREAA